MELYVLLVMFVVGTAGSTTIDEIYRNTYNWMFGGVDNGQGSYVQLGDRLNVLNCPIRASKVAVRCYAANGGVAPIHALVIDNDYQWECKTLGMEFKGYTEDVDKITQDDTTVFTIIADRTLKFVEIRGNGQIDSPEGSFIVKNASGETQTNSAFTDFIKRVLDILLDQFRTEVDDKRSQMS